MKYIAMNRFKIILGKENEFEQVWRTHETYLVDGFKEFQMRDILLLLSLSLG